MGATGQSGFLSMGPLTCTGEATWKALLSLKKQVKSSMAVSLKGQPLKLKNVNLMKASQKLLQ